MKVAGENFETEGSFFGSCRAYESPPNIMNHVMEGPYVTRKYWDEMIEGTIVDMGKDGAK